MAIFNSLFAKIKTVRHIKFLGPLLIFGLVGAAVTYATNAASVSTISGTTFQDINRNTVQDSGEAPFANVRLYLYLDGNYVTNITTNTNGQYQFSGLADGNYQVTYDGPSWWEVRDNWVPTTTNGNLSPNITVSLTGQATVNFGWRKIVRSTDLAAPITQFTGPNGLRVESFNDVVPAQEIYNAVMLGLVGEEAKFVTIRFDSSPSATSVIGWQGAPGTFSNYNAICYNNYITWITQGDYGVSHEYGHAWSLYYDVIVQQNGTLAAYLKARGLEGDSRVNSSYEWSAREMIAEDYRQLFGSANAKSYSQLNRSIPLAKDVPGLADFLQNTFTKPQADNIAPTVPANLSGKAISQSQVQLNWSASTDDKAVDKYFVFRNGQQIGLANAPSTTYLDDSSLIPNTSYKYSVQAIDAAGNKSAISSEITVTTLPLDTQAPTAPTSLRTSSIASNSISLTWNVSSDNIGVTGYRIYQTGGRKNTYGNLLGTAANNSFVATGLTANTSYSFYVVAIDGAGNQSTPSNTLTVKTRR